MKRLCLAFCLFLGSGCASDSDKAQWDAFWKDLRGDNMKMRGFSWDTPDGQQATKKSND
jgi:hypothetical protein